MMALSGDIRSYSTSCHCIHAVQRPLYNIAAANASILHCTDKKVMLQGWMVQTIERSKSYSLFVPVFIGADASLWPSLNQTTGKEHIKGFSLLA
jgi:hypothetical protein